MREECEDRHNTSAMFSCYSCNLVQCTKRAVAGRHIRCAACNLVLCTKCAVAGRHARCAGCSREAESRHAKWSVWAPRDAGDDASALHSTPWLVCCCCADKENDDGGGYARYIAHRDLQDLCTWCSECVERRGSADRCRTRADAAGDEAAADLEMRTISFLARPALHMTYI